jgi:uncharacterized protein (TIGR00251 family)
MFASSYGNGTIISVWIQPRASKTRVVGVYGDSIKIAVKSPPVEGKANEECIRFLAEVLGVPKAAVSIKTGHQGRHKGILVEGVTPDRIIQELGNETGHS